METITIVMGILLVICLVLWASASFVKRKVENSVLMAMSFIAQDTGREARDVEVNFLSAWHLLRSGISQDNVIRYLGDYYFKALQTVGSPLNPNVGEAFGSTVLLAKMCPHNSPKEALDWFHEGMTKNA